MTVKQSFSMVFVSSMRNNVQPVVMRVERQLEHALVSLKLTFPICLYESWTTDGECFLPTTCANNAPPDVSAFEQSVSMILLVLLETMLCLLS